ncbi:hypothetical protein [Sphingobium limneticum]|nr:hypothetical protein [Sphingobium limneticum]
MTDRSLLDRLSAAAQRGVSVAERRQQRVSFVYGNMPKGSDMSRHEVEKALDRLDSQDGRS